ncbi:MAG: hypothetical protein ABH881_03615, partial [bacterium]
MLCPNCKKQIPDDSSQCIYCDHAINHAEQLPQEIKQRRWQRWLFYAFFSLLFFAMIGTVVAMYNEKIKTIDELTQVQVELEGSKEELIQKQKELDDVKEEFNDRINVLQINMENKNR